MYSQNDLVDLISVGYALVFLVSVSLAAWLVKPWRWKAAALIMIVAAFAYPIVIAAIDQQKRIAQNKMIAERFSKLCKENAGEHIYKTVGGVEGFLILRPRKPTTNHQEYLDQFWMGDPYGHSDLEAENPEQVFLADRPVFSDGVTLISAIKGYSFIELPNNKDAPSGKYVRISVVNRAVDADGRQQISYSRTVTDTIRSRYALDWEDISSSEDRKYWTAAGQASVIDLRTREVLATRTGYAIDKEQGARIGGGVPWLLAQRNICPHFESVTTKNKEFIARVLKPLRETNHGQ